MQKIFVENLLEEPAFISKLSTIEVNMLLHQLLSKPIGIYCGEFFKITSAFLGSVSF